MITPRSMIEPIVNQNFGNTFQHQNGPNQRKKIHKDTSQKYQPRSYQISSKSSMIYLKEDCIGCGINNKETR